MEKLTNLWDQAGQLGQTALVVVLALAIYVFVRKIVLGRMERLAKETTNDLDDRLVHFMQQFLGLFSLFVVVLVVLRVNHIAISPLLAGAGIFGVALGFAAKETLADVLSGIFLIADRPVRVGDRVKIESIGRHWGSWGDVVDIGLRRTRIRNTDGVIVNYPNSLLSNSVISNFSFEPEPVRVRIRFQVGYDADIGLTRRVTLDAVYSIEGVIPGTGTVVVRSLWDDTQGHLLAGVLIEARYRIEDIRKRTTIRSVLLEKVLGVLQTNGIPLASQPIQITS